MLGAADLAPAASPVTVGDDLLVNVSSIGPALGITAQPSDAGFSLRTPDGRQWEYVSGGAAITSNGRFVPLGSPALEQGFSLFISVDAVAELAGLQLTVDRESRRVTLGRDGMSAAEVVGGASVGDGWQVFTVPRQQPAKRPIVRKSSPKLPTAVLPPSHEFLKLGLGLGYVQDADWGLNVSAVGRLLGGSLSLGALVTQGSHGTQLQSSRLRWVDEEKARGVEAGDLYSESWGYVRGVRYMWNLRSQNQSSGVSLYLDGKRTQNPRPLLAYRHDLRISHDLSACVELGSDTSNYANLIWDAGRAGIFAYSRSLPDGFGHSRGLMTTAELLPGITLSCGLNSSVESDGRSSDSSTIGLRVPLWRGTSLTLEQTSYDYDHRSMTSRGIGLLLPVSNNLRMSVRYHEHSLDFASVTGAYTAHSDSSGLATSLSLHASRRMHLDYQRSMYSRAGSSSYYERLVTNYRLSRGTTLQVISGFPDLTDSDLLRFRLNHQLSGDTSVLLEYGRQAPFQPDTDVDGGRGLMIMLRKTWPIMAPAVGGTVKGSVIDQTGQPLKGVAIRLGKYLALTDDAGKYKITCVPTGAYKLGLVPETVPADYRAEGEPQEIRVDRDSSLTRDFRVVPLGSIDGLVYEDKNGNGRFDYGEGVPEVTICVGDVSTATGADGRFSFLNIDPGKHVVRLATELLDKTYAVQGEDSLEVDLRAGESVTGLQFRLAAKTKPILFVQVD
jgi:hypothetical protein